MIERIMRTQFRVSSFKFQARKPLDAGCDVLACWKLETGNSKLLTTDNWLLSLELRRPLLQESLRAFVLVLGGTADGEQRGLQKEPVGQGHIEAAVHRLHRVLNGQR